jgi:hypothetical protein
VCVGIELHEIDATSFDLARRTQGIISVLLDGNSFYFTSNRGDFTFIWAFRLDPKTKAAHGGSVRH